MRYLTNQDLNLGWNVPQNYFTLRKVNIPTQKLTTPFLQALAKGGFQVGELAKCYYPGGQCIEELDYQTAKAKTEELLKQENIVIFEAATQYKNLFAKIDILEKKGNVLNLIEVKSKSAEPDIFENELWNQRELKSGVHCLKSTWRPYLYDVAFQSYILQKAFPHFEIHNYLMCADKSKMATVDGLNQKFLLIENENGQTKAKAQGEITKRLLVKKSCADYLLIRLLQLFIKTKK